MIMGSEYIFYPAFKRKEDGKYIPLLYNTDGKPTDVFWRSRSFIDGDFFTENFRMLGRDEFGEGFEEWGNRCKELSDNAPTYIYELTESELGNYGSTYGLVKGYVPLEEMEIYHMADSPQEYYYWQMSEPLPAEVYAEMPKSKQNKYGRFAHINTYGHEYICSLLSEILFGIITPYTWEGDKVMLMLYSF